MAVTGRFVALVALGAVPLVALPAASSWLVLLGWLGIVVALAALDLALAASPRRVRITRAVPDAVRLGETARAPLALVNTGRRMLRALVRDAWPPSAVAAPARARLTIPPGERRVVETRLTPFRRGERTAGAVSIRSFGPLALAARQASIEVPARLRVLPPFESRKHLPSRLARLRELDGATPLLVRGAGTEFDSLRDYVRGDDSRSIDWRASARRRTPDGRERLVVRTWRPERDRRVVIVVDSGRMSAARVDNEPRLDTAFECALLLAALATRAGDRVDLVVWDRRVRGRVAGVAGADLLHRMVTTMAPIEPELIETDWRAVPGLVRAITTQRALVVLLTTADAPGSSRSLLATLPELTMRHAVVVATVADPDVAAAAAGASRVDRASVYRAAAAERALLDAARVAAALRQSGAEVVTGAPHDLPPALADRYLALKAAGRL
ncbi:DUF58 domain-containing protein [Galbitalea sp. SE-J8]|uniref:DUF58 domain-containing protein n=1 Tax=Galbitalea sp. SE-J8 TaxID=3054952 RepID=UPI00259D210E|nr:DUF58 domain-containing protein [Galbitalea sp. SE-J8]MDM4762710.1 DUF58 domain-containing protein [Galbitalea sp. SE-J8]